MSFGLDCCRPTRNRFKFQSRMRFDDGARGCCCLRQRQRGGDGGDGGSWLRHFTSMLCTISSTRRIIEMASVTPLVIDSGTGVIKAGRCGQELPEVVFPSCVGRPKHHRVMASALEADALMGSDVQKHRGVCSLKYPCQRGVVQDWEDMQRVWGQVFRDLRVQPDEQPILFTESPLVSSAQVSLRAHQLHALR